MIVTVPVGYASEYVWMLAIAGAAAVLWYLVGLVIARRPLGHPRQTITTRSAFAAQCVEQIPVLVIPF